MGWVCLAAVAYLLTACTNRQSAAGPEQIKQWVEEYSTGARTAKAASITSHHLIVTGVDDRQTTFELPKDEFFVSIAPYVQETHPCAIHSLTGCRGEMANTSFEVYIEDSKGRVVLDRAMTSHANGFLDLWLPRDETYRVVIAKDGMSQEAVLTTFEGDDTCITTIRLTSGVGAKASPPRAAGAAESIG